MRGASDGSLGLLLGDVGGERAVHRRFGGDQPGRERRRRQLGIVQRHRQLQIGVSRQIEQLLQPQIGDLAVGALADHQRRQVVAADPRPQQLELRLRAGVEADLRLPQRHFGLADRFERDVDQPVAERRIVVRLRGLEQQLGAGRGERRGRPTRARPPRCPAARRIRPPENRFCENDRLRRQVFERPNGSASASPSVSVGRSPPLPNRPPPTAPQSIARSISATRDSIVPAGIGIERRAGAGAGAAEEAGELRRQRPIVAGRHVQLRKQAAAGARLFTLGAPDPGGRDRNRFAALFRQLQHLFERQRAGRRLRQCRQRPANEGNRKCERA